VTEEHRRDPAVERQPAPACDVLDGRVGVAEAEVWTAVGRLDDQDVRLGDMSRRLAAGLAKVEVKEQKIAERTVASLDFSVVHLVWWVEGKHAVVFGVANRRSIAWAIAQALSREGATLALTYENERVERMVEDCAEQIPGTMMLRCDVKDDVAIGRGAGDSKIVGDVTRVLRHGERIELGITAAREAMDPITAFA